MGCPSSRVVPWVPQEKVGKYSIPLPFFLIGRPSEIPWGYGGQEMRAWMVLVLGASFGAPMTPQVAPGQEAPLATLYFFFSPSDAASVEAAKRATGFQRSRKGEVRIRPIMLLEDFSVLRKLEESSPLTKTLKELETAGPLNIPLYDEEGLGLAERWEIRSVPAFVLVRKGRAHRALGPMAKLEELLSCTR